FDLDAVTTSIGGQARIDDGLFLGGALGWESSRLDDRRDSTRVEGDSYLAAVSLKRETGPWTLTGAVDLGWGDYDSARKIAFGTTSETAKGSPDAFTAGAHLRAAYEIPRGAWYMEPALDLDLIYVELDSYTESGAGEFNLAVDSADTVVLTGTPWLKLGRRVDLAGGGTLDAFVSGGVSFSSGEDFSTTARLAGAPSGAGDFTTEIDNPSVIGRISAGIDLYATDRLELRLQYDGSFADGQTSNGALFRLSYFF
ncbi:transporter, partial [Amaricoccus sp. HAR-UPW-R2A-40]